MVYLYFFFIFLFFIVGIFFIGIFLLFKKLFYYLFEILILYVLYFLNPFSSLLSHSSIFFFSIVGELIGLLSISFIQFSKCSMFSLQPPVWFFILQMCFYHCTAFSSCMLFFHRLPAFFSQMCWSLEYFAIQLLTPVSSHKSNTFSLVIIFCLSHSGPLEEEASDTEFLILFAAPLRGNLMDFCKEQQSTLIGRETIQKFSIPLASPSGGDPTSVPVCRCVLQMEMSPGPTSCPLPLLVP